MKERVNIFKNSIRKRRAISNISENGSHNESKEEQNRSKNSLKTFHRKTASSCLYGSYLSFNLESELSNNLNIDEINNYQIYDEPKSKIKNLKQVNHTKENDDDAIYDLSFHSYEIDNNNNNSITSKTNEDKNNNNKNNGMEGDIYDKNDNGKNIKPESINKEKENKCNNIEKSFVSFKNNLKYIKDKDERATQSYLLALGMTIKQNKKDEKDQYLPTTSVIEEEKSDMVESRSEYINTKSNILLEDSLNNSKNKNEEYYIKKDILKLNNNSQQYNDYKRSTYINIDIKNNDYNKRKDLIQNKFYLISVNKTNKKTIKRSENNLERNEKLIKMTDALKEIIDKNNKKEESKRMRLKKNKDILLNSFFNMTYNGKKNKINESYNNETKENNKTVFKNTEHNNNGEKLSSRKEKEFPFFHKKKLLNNSYISNLLKNRYNTESNGEKTTYQKNNNIKQNEDSNFILNSENKNIKFKNLNDSINSNFYNNRTFIIEENKQINNQIPKITKIEYKPSSRIPHLRQRIIESKEIRSSN